ncbi:MAG TPA: choice-of-anchor L domain-containing protein [Solirubrobacteraceae bacterium]
MTRAHCLAIAITGALLAAPAADAAVTANRDAAQLAAAMNDSNSVTITGASFLTIPPNGNPTAISDAPLGGLPTGGGTFAVMSTGDALKAADPNQGSVASTGAGGVAVRGDTDRDVTILKIGLNVPATANCLTIDVRFFSEEFPEYVGKSYNDAFIAELDSSDWKTAGSTITAPRNFAFDEKGNVISINATGPASVQPAAAAGTIYDAGTALLHASVAATPGAHDLYLSVFDQGDAILDSAVFVDNIKASKVAGTGCKSGATDQATPQPTGTPAGPVGSTPPAFGPNGVITGLPSAKKCLSRRNFRIRIRKRKGRVYQYASVFVNGKRVKVVRGTRLTAPVDLRGLPKGRFTVKIVVLTTTGEVIQGIRRYRTCVKKRPGSRPRL